MQTITKYKNILFILLAFISVFFLVVQPGVWAYLDASYQRTISYNIKYIFSSMFNITGYGYNGDRSQLIAGRYMQEIGELLLKGIFGMKRGAILFFLSYFCTNYFITKSILSQFVGKKYAYAGALLYTFNPLSLYMMNQVGFLYAYSAAPLMVFGFIQFFYKKNDVSKWLGILVLCLSTIFFTSYARFMLIYILFFVIIALFYYRDVADLVLKKTRQVVFASILIVCTSLPFIFSILYPHYSGESDYFAGMGNYATALRGWGDELYNSIKKTPLPTLISPQEPTANILGSLGKNNIFIYLSLIYFAFIIYFIFIHQSTLSQKEKKAFSIGITLVTIGVVCRLLPYYVPEEVFVSISYDILPFLASTSGFAYRFFIAGVSILIPLGIQKSPGKFGVFIVYGLLIYCLFVTGSLALFKKNPKLGTVHITKNNPIYDVIYGNNIGSIVQPQAAIIYPSSFLFFNWAPYPLHLEYIPGILPNIEGNERTTTSKQTELSRYISQQSIFGDNLTNLGILTISSFLVAQDINNNDDKIEFDRYNDMDYVSLAQQAENFLSNYEKVYLADTNALYKKYDINDANLFSFLIYLPKSIIPLSGYENIFDNGFVFKNRPFLVDDTSYNKPGYITEKYMVPNSVQQTISIKTRKENASAYYIKLGNVKAGQDILLQFNKTFSPSRKVKYINKKGYDSLSCEQSVYYPISENTYCHSDNIFPTFREFSDVLLSRKYKNIDHFEGNIIGNTWILKNIDNVDSEGNAYILISYDKQYLFIITQIIAIATLLTLVIRTAISLKKYHTHAETSN